MKPCEKIPDFAGILFVVIAPHPNNKSSTSSPNSFGWTSAIWKIIDVLIQNNTMEIYFIIIIIWRNAHQVDSRNNHLLCHLFSVPYYTSVPINESNWYNIPLIMWSEKDHLLVSDFTLLHTGMVISTHWQLGFWVYYDHMVIEEVLGNFHE